MASTSPNNSSSGSLSVGDLVADDASYEEGWIPGDDVWDPNASLDLEQMEENLQVESREASTLRGGAFIASLGMPAVFEEGEEDEEDDFNDSFAYEERKRYLLNRLKGRSFKQNEDVIEPTEVSESSFSESVEPEADESTKRRRMWYALGGVGAAGAAVGAGSLIMRSMRMGSGTVIDEDDIFSSVVLGKTTLAGGGGGGGAGAGAGGAAAAQTTAMTNTLHSMSIAASKMAVANVAAGTAASSAAASGATGLAVGVGVGLAVVGLGASSAATAVVLGRDNNGPLVYCSGIKNFTTPFGILEADLVSNTTSLSAGRAAFLEDLFDEAYGDVMGVCTGEFNRSIVESKVSCQENLKNGLVTCCEPIRDEIYGELTRCRINGTVHCVGCDPDLPLFSTGQVEQNLFARLLQEEDLDIDAQISQVFSSLCNSLPECQAVARVTIFNSRTGAAARRSVFRGAPSASPSNIPSRSPSIDPSPVLSFEPTSFPTTLPSKSPSLSPVDQGETRPTICPNDSCGENQVLVCRVLPSGLSDSCIQTIAAEQLIENLDYYCGTCTSSSPTESPSTVPSAPPSVEPSSLPSGSPSSQPSKVPSALPSTLPSLAPSSSPSETPSSLPSSVPSARPTFPPGAPTPQPTPKPPTVAPSSSPTGQPSISPSFDPTGTPSKAPTSVPSSEPTAALSRSPTFSPSSLPSLVPTDIPTIVPSGLPSRFPTTSPTLGPTSSPSLVPSKIPTVAPSTLPTTSPTGTSSEAPSWSSSVPTLSPSASPSAYPSVSPSVEPSVSPSLEPSKIPTVRPSDSPTDRPTTSPSANPSTSPSILPTVATCPQEYCADGQGLLCEIKPGGDPKEDCLNRKALANRIAAFPDSYCGVCLSSAPDTSPGSSPGNPPGKPAEDVCEQGNCESGRVSVCVVKNNKDPEDACLEPKSASTTLNSSKASYCGPCIPDPSRSNLFGRKDPCVRDIFGTCL